MKQDEAMEPMELLERLPARVVDASQYTNESCLPAGEFSAGLKAASVLAKSGCWSGVVAAAWSCFIGYSVLCALAIGF